MQFLAVRAGFQMFVKLSDFSRTCEMGAVGIKIEEPRKPIERNRKRHGIEHQSVFAKKKEFGVKEFRFKVQCSKFKVNNSLLTYLQTQ